MEYLIETLQSDWESLQRLLPRLLYAGVVMGIAFLASLLAGRMTSKLLKRTGRFLAGERLLRLVVVISVNSIGLLVALSTLGLHSVAASLLASGGVFAIVLGFAFKEIGENFLAGIFLSFSRPFELGDLIRTGDLTGIIKAIELRHVHVRTFDACDVFVPSATIFSEPLYNYTRDGLRRPSFTVGVSYESAPETVIDCLSQAAAGTREVLGEPVPFVTIREFSESYITYEVFFWMDQSKAERGYVEIVNDVKARCWHALFDAGMTFSADVTAGVEISGADVDEDEWHALQDAITKED